MGASTKATTKLTSRSEICGSMPCSLAVSTQFAALTFISAQAHSGGTNVHVGRDRTHFSTHLLGVFGASIGVHIDNMCWKKVFRNCSVGVAGAGSINDQGNDDSHCHCN